MEIRLLRYFWTVATEQNISQAAKALHITQPTLSRQIHELEAEVGEPLFDRQHKRLMLTQAGLFLKERAAEILQLDQQLEEALRQKQQQQLSGSFTIGCVEADNSDTLALMLEELVSDYPQVHFELVAATSDEISDRLEKGLLDLAILLEPVMTKTFETLTLPREERWGLLVSKSNFLAQKTTIQAADLLGTPLLCTSREPVQQLISAFAGVPFSKLNVVGTYNLSFNVFPLVAHDVGAAVTIAGAVTDRLGADLVFVPLAPAIKTHCILAWKSRLHTPVVAELIRRFKHAFEA
ncbi:LysR family transcriptional regulator [Lapidilactobacillus luobeiensis]|uniref:LysR family transcriptional regulator n=1 Tax=Lapidilactobacillus luobeiensis TaxID=2950371 RepID=UPI0021C2CB95|nr:LysR family transcriptional regulator [Lapidilactobacillus luobeiensis]